MLTDFAARAAAIGLAGLALALGGCSHRTMAPPPEAPIVLVATFEIAPGREQEFKDRALAFAEMAEAAEPGVVYRLHESKDRPGSFLFYEIFPSKAALERVQNDVTPAHRAKYGPTPAGLFVRPPEEQSWTPLN